VTLALLAGTALAAPGDLDTGFDGDGRRVIDYGGSDVADAVAIQPDGKVCAPDRARLQERRRTRRQVQ
jgi:hypothetical protein